MSKIIRKSDSEESKLEMQSKSAKLSERNAVSSPHSDNFMKTVTQTNPKERSDGVLNMLEGYLTQVQSMYFGISDPIIKTGLNEVCSQLNSRTMAPSYAINNESFSEAARQQELALNNFNFSSLDML